MKFVSNGPINNILALVQILAWRQPRDKTLSEPMMVRLPTHVYASLGPSELSTAEPGYLCTSCCKMIKILLPQLCVNYRT